jgi:chitodextrinase
VDLAWDASTDPAPGSGVAAYEVFRDGVSAATVSTTSYSSAGLAANTTYTFTVRAIDGAGNVSAQSNPLAVTTDAAAGGGTLLRIDTGATTAPFVDSQGRTWQPDFGFNSSKTSTKVEAIAGTVDDVLYHTVRYDPVEAPELLYTLPVENGTYTVRLHFVEKYSGAFTVGARVFDIDIEGTRAFEDIDIFAAVGARTAYMRETTATVSDGALHIQFHRQAGDPNISAIEVIPAGGG